MKTVGRMPLLLLAGLLVHATDLHAQLVPPGSTWSYLDDGSDQGTAWRATAFDDSAWAVGNAQLGYGEGDETTVVSFGGNPSAKFITTYFRHEFQVANHSGIDALMLHLVDDAGSVVYLNGVEMVRSNLPAGPLDHLTEAVAFTGVTGNIWSSFLLEAGGLVSGSNVLAVEIHQKDPDSSSISFDLELEDVTGLPVVRGPYLQMAGPDRVVLRWRTPVPTDSLVQVGSAPGSLTTSFQDPSLTTEHAITLTGLTSDTVYYYSVGETGVVHAGDDADHWFTTPPDHGADTSRRIWVLGDCGAGTPGQAAVRDAFLNFSLSDPADLVLLLGDNAYVTGNDGEYQTAVFDMYAETFRTTPFCSTRGNHEMDPFTYYDLVDNPAAGEVGGLASGTEAYFSFDYANIHFV
ncbi:MAG: purple acid phosphatase family protein, partial [Planctomycetota bacterium]